MCESSLLSRQAQSSDFPLYMANLSALPSRQQIVLAFSPKTHWKSNSQSSWETQQRRSGGEQQSAPPPLPEQTPLPSYRQTPARGDLESDDSLNTENIPSWQTPPQQSPLSLMLHLQSVT